MNITNPRPIRAEISLSALPHNLSVVRRLAPEQRVFAVVKANAYGHGMLRVAQALNSTDGFAVASIEEGIALRQHGFLHPILLLEGVFNEQDLPLIYQHRLDIVVHQTTQLSWLENCLKSFKIPSPAMTVWFKLDTGMHRLGFQTDEDSALTVFLQKWKDKINAGWMSHFATADEDLDFANHQLSQFNQRITKLEQALQLETPWPRSMSNSAAIQNIPQSHFQWVRPGIMLYGASQPDNLKPPLQPVMRFTSAIIALKWVDAGECIGYGCTVVLNERKYIAIVAAGYGDGYPRHAKSGTPVYCCGQRLPTIGRVSMDMIAIDATMVASHIQLGEEVELWGEHIKVDEVAERCGTISYELLCGVTQRVPRVYK